jgi:hypothetical protein
LGLDIGSAGDVATTDRCHELHQRGGWDWHPRIVGLAPALGALTGVAGLALVWLLDGLGRPHRWKPLFGAGCLVWLVAYVNAFNFMDGINGISAAQSQRRTAAMITDPVAAKASTVMRI